MNLNLFGVLVLNSAFLPIGVTSYKKALICLNSEVNGRVTAKAIHIEFGQIGENSWDFNKIINLQPIIFEDWMKLPIMPYDEVVSTTNKKIKLPHVIVTLQFSKMPMRQIKLSKKSILERDNFICQYTNERLPRHLLNVDHQIPKSKGGKDTWENLVTTSKKLNSKKGNKLNEEIGLKLIRQPKKPLPIPASALIKNTKENPYWKVFLRN